MTNLSNKLGQESFRSISRAYYRNAAGCLLVFDMGRRETFLHLKTWLEDVGSYGNDMIKYVDFKSPLPILTLSLLIIQTNQRCIVVANKSDQSSQRTVTTAEAQAFANAHGMLYIETSAKTSINVNLAFTSLAEKIYNDLGLSRDLSQIRGEEVKRMEDCGVKVGPRKPLVLVPSPSPSTSCC